MRLTKTKGSDSIASATKSKYCIHGHQSGNGQTLACIFQSSLTLLVGGFALIDLTASDGGEHEGGVIRLRVPCSIACT
jgi:hypothetical protein